MNLDILIADENTLRKMANNPNATPDILSEILDRGCTARILGSVLNSPALNQTVYMKVFNKVKEFNYDSTVLALLIENQFATKEIVDFVAKRVTNSYLARAVLKTKFTTEDTCITMIKSIPTNTRLSPINMDDISTDIIKEIAASPFMTPKVIDEIIQTAETDEIMSMCLDNPLLTSQQFEKIVNKALKERSIYRNSIKKIINSTFMTSTILLNMLDKYPALASNSTILNSPACNKAVLLKILDSDLSLGYLDSYINHKDTDAEVLLKMLKKIQDLRFIGFSDDNMGNYLKIINHPQCNKRVLLEIIKSNPKPEIIEMIKNSSNADKQIKTAIILSKNTVTENDIDTILSMDDNTEEDYINLIDVFPNEMLINKLIEKKDLSNELIMKIINTIYEEKLPTTSMIIPKLLTRDLPEVALCEIIKKDNLVDNILLAGSHPNAGVNVAAALRVVAEKFNEKYSENIYELASEIKRKVLEDVFVIEEEENVTEVIRANVEDGLTTMLWGPSGVGKSSRVFEIDPTATMLILKNGMLPEEVVGGKEPNGEPEKIYPPHWYTVLCEKCEKEPDRQHILFIDEFTNVTEPIKNLVWEVIGDRVIKGNEAWPLPDNCSIIVAGNRPEESTAVRIDSNGGVMPAPLHNRIDSMLEIKFDLDEWQKWALETNPKTGKPRIHPIVYSFCVSNAEEVMFTNFDPEDVTKPFLTPRKWESLSNTIYKAEERGENHHVSNRRIKSIIGDNEISEAFIAHYERLPLDMDKIENGGYSQNDFISIEDKLYALGIILANYEGDEMAVESFIVECLGEDYLSIYEHMKNKKAEEKEQKHMGI